MPIKCGHWDQTTGLSGETTVTKLDVKVTQFKTFMKHFKSIISEADFFLYEELCSTYHSQIHIANFIKYLWKAYDSKKRTSDTKLNKNIQIQ